MFKISFKTHKISQTKNSLKCFKTANYEFLKQLDFKTDHLNSKL